VSSIDSIASGTRVVRAPSLSVIVALAWVEAIRIIRHPLTIVGAVAGTALFVVATWTIAPVLNRDESLTNEALLPVAAAVLVVSHLATSRSLRHRTTELHDSSPSSTETETAAHLLSVVIAGMLFLILVAAQLAYLKTVGGVGTPRPFVVLTGPAIVIFAGAVGVALGRWAPWPVAGPLALIATVGISLALLGDSAHKFQFYFSPFLPSENWAEAVGEFNLRPAGWHLAYVLGLAGVAACAAFLRRVGVVATIALAGALLFTSVAAYEMTRPPTHAEKRALTEMFVDAGDLRSCETHDGVRYCAYRNYTPWIDRWRAAVEPVLDAIPVGARPRQLVITQLPLGDEIYAGEAYVAGRMYERMRRRGLLGGATEIHPGLHWGRNGNEGEYSLALALEVAARVTGIETGFQITKEDIRLLPPRSRKSIEIGRRARECFTFNQGRAIVALWLAAYPHPDNEGAFSRALESTPYGPRPIADFFAAEQYALSGYRYQVLGGQSFIFWGNREAHYAGQLLSRTDDEVRSEIQSNWARLTDPKTTSEEAAGILALEPLPTLKEVARSHHIRNFDAFHAPLCR
jgi:hypothetical protein